MRLKTVSKSVGVVVLFFIICAEYDRRSYRKKVPTIKEYLPKIPLSPISCFVKMCSNSDQLTPFVDIEENFEDFSILEDNWKTIRDEALALIAKGKTTAIQGDQFFSEKITSDGKWKKYYIKWYTPISEEVENDCPRTVELIKSIPSIKLAMFSILEPGAQIKPHLGPFKSCLRYHLGLDTPEDERCFISVDGEKYSWKNGESVLFDDTFEHWVRNDTSQRRVILFCDVQRKLRSPISNAINGFIVNKLAPITTRINDRQEKSTYDEPTEESDSEQENDEQNFDD